MIYFGIVRNIQDPENAGRVKVKVIGLYDSFSDESLPWAYVTRSTDLGPTQGRGQNQHNLIIGSQVTVDFLDTEFQQPIVIGIVPRKEDIGQTNPFIHERTYINGTKTIISEDPDNPYEKIIDPSGNMLLMDKTGITIDSDKNLLVKIKGDNKIEINGNVSQKIIGNIDQNVSGDVKMEVKGNTTVISPIVDASKSKKIILPDSATSMFTTGPIDTFTGQPNKKTTN